MTGQRLNYDKHCKVEFVITHKFTNNTTFLWNP